MKETFTSTLLRKTLTAHLAITGCTPHHSRLLISLSKSSLMATQKNALYPHLSSPRETEEATPEVEDIFSPEVSREIATTYGIAKENQISYYCRSLEKFKVHFPTQKVQTKNGASIKYIPLATHASEGKLEVFGNFDFDGLTPYEFYQKFIKA
ncbi:hypothetical protein BG51_00475 [Pseudomonas [fluorescens] ATCC 17400]